MSNDVRCLSRIRPNEHGGAFAPSDPNDPDEGRQRAGQYLAGRMMLPGAMSSAAFSRHVSRELDAMTPRERIFLEIEMAERAEAAHSYEYDPSGWSRR